MTNLIYAVKINDLKTGGLRVLDVKIGKTSNINRTLKTYRRSARDIAVLDLWEPNKDLTLSQCETGVHYLAEKYAYSKEREKFIFLQDKYDEFSKNVSRLLKKITPGKSESKKAKKMIRPKKVKKVSKSKKLNYKTMTPKYVRFKKKEYEVSSWSDVIRVVFKQIFDETDDFSKISEVKGPKKLYFTNRKKILINPAKIPDTPYYFEGKFSSNKKVRIINKLLITFGYNESDLKIEFE